MPTQVDEIPILGWHTYIKTGINEMVIDSNTAPIVREIFDLFINGYGKYEIATIMNKKDYLTPSQLKKAYEKRSYTKIWNKQHIERILDSVIYTGDMPYGMRRKKSFKSKKYENVPKENWIIVPNHHEAIISREVFNQAQNRIKRYEKYPTRNPSKNMFSGLLFCGRCGSRMYKKVRKGYSPWYNCKKNNIEGAVKDSIKQGYGCNSHRITESKLIVCIQVYIGMLLNESKFKEGILPILDSVDDKKKSMSERIKILENKIETVKYKASKIYDDKLEGMIPDFLFKQKLDEINEQIEKDSQEIAELQDYLKQIFENEGPKDYYTSMVEQIKQNGINNKTLELLFKKIIIFEAGDINETYKTKYDLSNEEYQYIFRNGGILFIQSILYKAIIAAQLKNTQ